MIDANETAYPTIPRHPPRFDDFAVTEDELDFVRANKRSSETRLSLLAMLKCHQYLNRLPSLDSLPDDLVDHFKSVVPCRKTGLRDDPQTRHRNLALIRERRGMSAWSSDLEPEMTELLRASAWTRSDPKDLINLAVEWLDKRKIELPAFTTLERMAQDAESHVYDRLISRIYDAIPMTTRPLLEPLVEPDTPGQNSPLVELCKRSTRYSNSQAKEAIARVIQLDKIAGPSLDELGVAHTWQRKLGAYASDLEISDLAAITDDEKRHSLIYCVVRLAAARGRDDITRLVMMRVHRSERKGREDRDLAEIAERDEMKKLFGIFDEVIPDEEVSPDEADERTSDWGHRLAKALHAKGGALETRERIRSLILMSDSDHRPFMWKYLERSRKWILPAIDLLKPQSASSDDRFMNALDFVLEIRARTRNWVRCDHLDLGFLSRAWLDFCTEGAPHAHHVNRIRFQLSILHELREQIRRGDVFIPNSEAYDDYRKQLLAPEEFETQIDDYQASLGRRVGPGWLVQSVRERLETAAEKLDERYGSVEHLEIDADGKPRLKRLQPQESLDGLDGFKEEIRKRMPARELLEVLHNTNTWTDFVGPLTRSRSADLSSDEVAKQLFNVFARGANVSISEMERHAPEQVSARALHRANKQQCAASLEASRRRLNEAYHQFELTRLWGSGEAAIADGTQIGLRENNLVGERHIRYGGYGGIAYHHISDTYIALFSSFIPCGVWEAVHILDPMVEDVLPKPQRLHADTHGQSETVFGLSYLLGIELMPRMRNWNKVNFYRASSDDQFENIDSLFSASIDWDLIRRHYTDIMLVALSIKAGKIKPSTLLSRLGGTSKKNHTFSAIRELGRAIRTGFLLDYMRDTDLRRTVDRETVKVESFHAYTQWIRFGGDIITSGDSAQHDKSLQYTGLIANALMLQNVSDLSRVLREMIADGFIVRPEYVARLSPYMHQHVLRYGRFSLDLESTAEPMSETTWIS